MDPLSTQGMTTARWRERLAILLPDGLRAKAKSGKNEADTTPPCLRPAQLVILSNAKNPSCCLLFFTGGGFRARQRNRRMKMDSSLRCASLRMTSSGMRRQGAAVSVSFQRQALSYIILSQTQPIRVQEGRGPGRGEAQGASPLWFPLPRRAAAASSPHPPRPLDKTYVNG